MDQLKKLDNLISKFLARLNKREKLLFFSAFFLAVIFLPYWLVYQPAGKKIMETNKKITAREQDLRLLETQAQALKNKTGLPPGDKDSVKYFQDFSELLGFIGQLSRRHQLEIISFFPRTAAENSGRDKTDSSAKGKKPAVSHGVLCEIKMRGVYQELFGFFKEISLSQYLIGFQSVIIKKDPKYYPRLTASLVVVTLYAKDK
jgi:hypothetical protein